MKILLKKTFILILCATLLLQAAPWAYAAEMEIPIDTFTYKDNGNGTATITGCTGAGTTLVIPDTIQGLTVTAIQSHAFYNCTDLEALTLPDTLTSIGEYAFSGCTGLSVIDLPEGLTYLGNRAFGYITNDLTVKIPASLTKAEAFGPFRDSHVTTVEFKPGVTTVAERLLEGITTLTSITLPDTLTSIGAYAFSGCTGLKEIVLPDSVTRIQQYAFEGCTGLTEVTLSASLTTIGNGAFDRCTGLTELTLPGTVTSIGEYAFSGCTGLSVIDLPEGLTYLGNRAFGYITNDLTVKIPASLTKAEAFGPFRDSHVTNVEFKPGVTTVAERLLEGITTLTSITLPDTLTSIGAYAFSGCTGLTNIVLPDSVTKIQEYAFEGCTGLTSVALSNQLQTIAEGTFEGCTGLTEVTLPDTLTVLDDYAFYGCTGLTEMVLPDNLQSLGANCFRTCTALERVICGNLQTDIHDWAFLEYGGEIYADKGSAFAIHAVDNELSLVLTDYSIAHTWLDSSACAIRTTTSNGLIHVTVSYAVTADLDPRNLFIRIPASAALWETTGVTLNSKAVSDYDFDVYERILTVPLSASDRSGTVRFSLEQTQTGSLRLYARLQGWHNRMITETVDVLLGDMPAVTISAPERVSSTFRVSGIAPAGETVSLSVDGAAAGSAAANALGRWSADVSLTNPGPDYTSYTVTASAGDQSASATVVYGDATPELKHLYMYYNNHQDACVDLVANENPYLTFNPNVPLTFVAEFENGSEIDRVFITANRNGEKRTMEAVYDAATDRYLASGTFDHDGIYVPGAIGVEYTLKKKEVSMSQTIADMEALLESLQACGDLEKWVTMEPSAQEVQAASVVGGPVRISSTAARISVPALKPIDTSVSILMETYQVSGGTSAQRNPVMPQDTLLSTLPGVLNCYRTNSDPLSANNVTVSADGKWLRFTTTDSQTGETYYISCNSSEPGQDLQSFAITVEKASGDEVIRFFVSDLSGDKADAILGALDGIGDAAKLLDMILEANDIATDYSEMVREIYRTVPPEQQEAALREARRVRNGRSDYMVAAIALAAVTKYLAAAGMLAGPAGAVAAGLLLAVALSGEHFSQYAPDSESLLSRLFNLNLIVDPSGYVYEAVTTNRLEGVTTTAYWIPEPTEENADLTAFYAEAPDDSVTGTLWNAADYNQQNPMTTDWEGRYAWDVPAGWWRVKYELEGYETAYSEWLPVPPPQLEVNEGMVSRETPEIVSVEAETDQILVTFSKYMQPETVAATLTVNGSRAFTVDWPKNETAADGTVYARTFTLTPTEALEADASVTVAVSAEALSYAGVAASAAPFSTTVGGAPKLIVDEEVTLYYGQSVTLPVTVENLDSPRISLQSRMPMIVSADGLTLIGNLPGETTVTVQVAGTNLTRTIPVRVVYQPLSIFAVDMKGEWETDGLHVTVTLANTTDTAVTETYICAAYDGNRKLLGSFMTQNRTTAAGETQLLTHTFPTGTALVKLFRLGGSFCPTEEPVWKQFGS